MKKHLIAFAAATMTISVNAARVCSEVTLPYRGVVLACKNVPDEPRGEPIPKPPGQQSTPTKPAAKPAAQVAPPVLADVPEANFGNMPDSKQAFSGIAQSSALVLLMPSAVGKSTLNLGAANFGGQSAIGLTFAHRTNSLVLSAGAAFGSGGKNLVRLGAGMEF
jgi:hypothetical protein